MTKPIGLVSNNTNLAFAKETLAVQWYEFLHDVHAELVDIYNDAHKRGIDQKEIGRRLQMNAGQVSRYLRGRQNMTIRTIHNLARAMECRPMLTFVRLDSPALGSKRTKRDLPGDTGTARDGCPDAGETRQ